MDQMRSSDPRGEQRRKCFNPLGIILGEAGTGRAVEIDHCDHLVIAQDRNHEFAGAGGIAGDMAGKGVDIHHKLRGATFRRRAAYARTERYADAGRAAHERPEHQFIGPAGLRRSHPVEPRPVQIGQELRQERRDIRHVGDRIGLTIGQRIGRREQFAVEVLRGERGFWLEIVHGGEAPFVKRCRGW